MAHSQPNELSPEFLRHELYSESTLPLLSYLIRNVHARETDSDQTATDIFHEVKRGIGLDDRPIPDVPDESEQVEPAMLLLMKEGPSGNGTKIQGAPKVTIVGAGTSGLCAGFELKKAGFDITILEASSRVGGRVKTFRDPYFAPGLHGEGGAMRIPRGHKLTHKYIEEFGLNSQLFEFEMLNKFIFISGLGRTVPYGDDKGESPGTFNHMLVTQDEELLKLFPNLKEEERGKTCDQLFNSAVVKVVDVFLEAYNNAGPDPIEKVKTGYKAITDGFDKYSLRSYLQEVAHWSEDAINLYDLGSAHVFYENAFIESFKDAFVFSNDGSTGAKMQQLQSGMSAIPDAFISPERGNDSLIDNIRFGARVNNITVGPGKDPSISTGRVVTTTYETVAGDHESIDSDYLILAIPYTAQRAISKGRNFVPVQEMAVRDVRYVEVTKVLLQYKTRWWEEIFTKNDLGTDGGLVSDLPIRYTVFPKSEGNEQFDRSERGVVLAAYTFEQDATILGSLSHERRIRQAADNLHRVFPGAKSLDLLEAGVSQVFPCDELAGGSAFCHFSPTQKMTFLDTMIRPDWDEEGDQRYKVFFAGEQASFTHGWVQGAFEAGLRCVQQVWDVAIKEQQVQ